MKKTHRSLFGKLKLDFCCRAPRKSYCSFDPQAEDGVGIPEDVLNDARFERAMRFYFVYLRLDWLWSLNLFALILLNFLEVSYQKLPYQFVMVSLHPFLLNILIHSSPACLRIFFCYGS